MVFPGGNFAVVNPATLGLTDKASAAIVAQIASQITAKFEDFLGPEWQRVLNTLPAILEEVKFQKTQIEAIIAETATLTLQLNERMPEVGDAQAAVTASLQDLAKRDREVSDKLKESCLKVETQLSEISV